MISAAPPKLSSLETPAPARPSRPGSFHPRQTTSAQEGGSWCHQEQLCSSLLLGRRCLCPCTAVRIQRLSSLRAQWEGRSPLLCPPGQGTKEPGCSFASKTRNTLRTRSAFAPWVRPGKHREQRHKCCQLQPETQLHPNSKALFAAGSVPLQLQRPMERLSYLFKVGDLRRGHSKLTALSHQ